MGKKKMIFVDDEPNILTALRRMLRSFRDEYDMHYAASGKQALEIMEGDSFDVIVSDMRMPGMDGAQLLEIVQKKYPHTIRIMLTGQADQESILRTVGFVHQFLTKPCDPEKLKTVLVKTGALQDMLFDGRLKDLISQVGKLPSLPSTYARLQKAIADPEVEINEIGEIIAQDIAMTAKVLQLVNSSFFGVYTRVNSPGRAVSLLGLDTIKVLVLSFELFSKAQIPKEIFQIDTLWEHSLMVGKIARDIAVLQTDDKEWISDTFLAGTLHDLGRLVLLSSLPSQYVEVINMAKDQDISMPEAEKSFFGVTQSALGAYLVGLWGFSSPIVEGIGFQNTMENYPDTVFSPAIAIHVANVLYYRNRPEEVLGRQLDLNMVVLQRLGLEGEVAKWEKQCVSLMQGEA